ncbi:MAG: DNA-3-methyladenine glycosylase I [Chloroflexi bacterium]|nr:DNA-3-methyladenine glycosylase I [Chloroflexota bacterium]
MTPARCAWAGADPLMVAYHDAEWGVPCADERRLFEFLILETAQAGLSWRTILQRRDGYRRAFAGFDAAQVAAFGETDRARLLSDTSIIRNRLKIEAAIQNARQVLQIQQAFGGFARYLWRFVDGHPRVGRWASAPLVPTTTAESMALSADLRRRGFRFVGPTICYAYMQAMGLVNDHERDCFRCTTVPPPVLP